MQPTEPPAGPAIRGIGPGESPSGLRHAGKFFVMAVHPAHRIGQSGGMIRRDDLAVHKASYHLNRSPDLLGAYYGYAGSRGLGDNHPPRLIRTGEHKYGVLRKNHRQVFRLDEPAVFDAVNPFQEMLKRASSTRGERPWIWNRLMIAAIRLDQYIQTLLPHIASDK